jgi:hypothetical protein
MAAIVEDGTGVTGANAYQSETDTASDLVSIGLGSYDSLSAELKTFALTSATAQVDAEVYAGCGEKCYPDKIGEPLSPTQGLYFPRTSPYDGVPSQIVDAATLQAEIIAREIEPAEGADYFPESVLEVEMAKGVRVKKAEGKLDSAIVSNLRSQVDAYLAMLKPSKEPFVFGVCGA